MNIHLKSRKMQETVSRYIAGETTKRIGRSYGVSGETVRCWLSKAGVTRRSRDEYISKYTYSHEVFKYPTAEAAYWAGLLMADGHISTNGKLISLELLNKDVELVRGFHEFIGYTGPICTRTKKYRSGKIGKYAAVRVTAGDLVDQLKVWGVVSRKTHIGVVGDVVFKSRLESHFFRGMFDGDGCVHRRKNGKLYLNFCGNFSVVDAFRDWCWKLVREVGSLSRHSRYCVVQFGGNTAKKVGQLVYACPGPRLRRKESLIC